MPKRRRAERPPPLPADGETALRTRDERASERAAAYRRRHKHTDELCGAGNRVGSWAALGRLNGIYTPCGACGALCRWTRVLIDAGAEAGAPIAPEHGCAAPTCSRSRHHQPPRHAAAQRRWAEQLRAGTGTLIERPAHAEQPSARVVIGDELEATIAAALAHLE